MGMVALLMGCAKTPEERRGSIYELRRDPTPANVAKIRAMLTDPDRDIRATALNTLVGMGVPDADQLALDGLEDNDGFVRSIAAKRLGDLGNEDNAGLLAGILIDDPDPRARRTAAQALEAIGGDVAADGLARGLDDPMKDVRLAAVTGLRKVDPGRAPAALARLLLEDSSWEVRVQAAGALGLAGDTAMIHVLEAALDDESQFVRSAATAALAHLRRIDAASVGAGPSPPSGNEVKAERP
jgi:HEAT repeat protein